MKYFLVGLILLWSSVLNGHPDTAVPFWYPSAYMYGFINGCSETIEQSQVPFTQEMWPEQVKEVCGCVVDALRHSMTFQELTAADAQSQAEVQLIVNATMPICVSQIQEKKS